MIWTLLKCNVRAYNIARKDECFGVLEDTLIAFNGEVFAIIQALFCSALIIFSTCKIFGKDRQYLQVIIE